MTRSVTLTLSASLLLLALAGCQQQSAPAPAATPGTQASAAPSLGEVPAISSSALSVEPATIAKCGTGVVATVRWNAQAANATTSTTQIWVGSNPNDIKLFSENGAQGETQTGPWTGPGTYFVLKNKDDGKVLAQATIGGPKCP